MSPVGPDVNDGEPGGVTSMVMVSVTLTVVVGPAFEAASSTEPDARSRPRVPLVGDPADRVTVYGPSPEPETESTVHPVDVPVGVNADAMSPVTGELKVTRNVAGPELVGDVPVLTNALTPGAVRSMVMAGASCAAAGPVLPAASVTASATRRATTVPSEQPVAVTVMLAPDAAEGVNVQPVAVPWLAKSPDAMPLTDSLKARVNTGAAELVGLAGGVHVAVGGVPSNVTVFADAAVPGAVLPAGSLTAPDASASVTVPSPGDGLSRLTV